MTITIREIARRAGVSRGTVDRVLNGREGVRPEVRRRVLDLAQELNYVPNQAGKALAYSKRSTLFGVVMPPKEVSFFDEVRQGIEEAADELKDMGIRLEIRNVDNKSSKEGALAIDSFVQDGVSGIMISLMDDERIRDSINHAAEKGVPVVTFNSDVSNCRRICFVGQDLVKSGRIAAGLMNRILEEKAEVIVVAGNLDFHAHRARVDGFREGIAGSPKGLQIVRVIESFDRYSDTYNQLVEEIGKHTGIHGIYMATGHIRACLDAMKQYDKTRRIRVVSNDLVPEVLHGMRDGRIDFTIMQNPRQQGYRSLRILHELVFHGKKPEQEYYYTDTHIYIPESL